MKKILPLLASIMLLSACGAGGTSTSGSASSSSEPTSSSSSSKNEHFLTFLNDGELYIDFNFDNAPEGLSIKIGDTTLTAPGKVTMSKDFTYQVSGTFANSINIYSVIDANGSKGVGKGEGIDSEIAKERIERYLGNYSSKQYGYRIYFCLSDKASGWSKTLPGVDEAIRNYSPF